VHRNNLGTSKLSRRFKEMMTRLAPYAAAVSAALILWHAARDTPTSVAFAPAPLIYPHAPAAAPLADLSPPQTPQVSAAGPLAIETPVSGMFGVSSVLDGSSFAFGDDRSQISVN
jgi:hypothetical protein